MPALSLDNESVQVSVNTFHCKQFSRVSPVLLTSEANNIDKLAIAAAYTHTECLTLISPHIGTTVQLEFKHPLKKQLLIRHLREFRQANIIFRLNE